MQKIDIIHSGLGSRGRGLRNKPIVTDTKKTITTQKKKMELLFEGYINGSG